MMPKRGKRKATNRKSREAQQRKYIEQIAYELYQNRVLLGKAGDAQSDWQTAERIVKSPLKTALFASHRPFIRLEKQVWEPLLRWSENQALLSLLGVIGNVGLILAVVTYIGSEKQRRDAEVRNAWQTITSAYGQSGSGGRLEALEFLNASPGANWRRRFPWFCAPLSLCTWPAESLDGINLSAQSVDNTDVEQNDITSDNNLTRAEITMSVMDLSSRVYLSGIQLPNAYLQSANLEQVNLINANLEGARLADVNMKQAYLWEINLKKALLYDANLEGAVLGDANLEGAVLVRANLKLAFLSAANLETADLGAANLEEANLGMANLKRANLKSASMKRTGLFAANLEGANLEWADLEGAELIQLPLQDW